MGFPIDLVYRGTRFHHLFPPDSFGLHTMWLSSVIWLVWHSVEISEFFYHSYFTWNQFWRLKSFKIAVFAILRLWRWSIGSAFEKCKNSYKSQFRASKWVKMADFALLDSPSKLISRKIWVEWQKNSAVTLILREIN